jgi:hypothetical protein
MEASFWKPHAFENAAATLQIDRIAGISGATGARDRAIILNRALAARC